MIVQLELLGQMVVAIILGGVIGFEREAANKPAGLRTHMLVAASATLLTGFGEILINQIDVDQSLIQVDPVRIIEAIITGISFLGAGTIIFHRGENKIEGLTTAASMLLVATLGIAVAMNQFILAIGGTVVILVILRLLSFVSHKV